MAQRKNSHIFDGRGIVHLIRGKALHVAVKRAPEEVWSISLSEIEDLARPTTSDRLIKSNFWSLLNKVDLKSGVKLGSVYRGISSQTNFYNYFLKNPYKVVWLLRPTDAHDLQIRVLQQMVLDKLEAIVKLPLTDSKGKIAIANVRDIIKSAQVIFGIYDKM